ncbi:MAG TPA: hypothetical protein VEG60_16265 [Candidatus Binatia bacterium]|nr:hypothetical protein [Candidatus Binatia bacterium]
MLKNRIQTTPIVVVVFMAIVLTATGAAQMGDKIVRIDSGILEGAEVDGVISFNGRMYG